MPVIKLMRRREFIKKSASILASPAMLASSVAVANSGGEHPQTEVISLTAGKQMFKLGGMDHPPSPLWLYNNKLPGPVIRGTRDQNLKIQFTNQLDEPTTVHWHGIRLHNAMDGVSGLTQQPVQPGESFVYEFTPPDAGTYWYHAHHQSWNQVPRGLFGPLIIDETEPVFDRQHDLVLMLSDWLVDDDEVLDTGSFGSPRHASHAGRLGNFMTVNGKSRPVFDLYTDEWYRVRVINACSSRVLPFNPASFKASVIAVDGQPLPAPRKVDDVIRLAPSQRIDLLIRNDSPGLLPLELLLRRQTFEFASLNFKQNASSAQSTITSVNQVPTLPVNNKLTEPDVQNANQVELVMNGGAMSRLESLTHQGEVLQGRRFVETGQFWGFNGYAGMPENPLFSASPGTSVVISLFNDTAFEHGIHLHGHHFRVISREGTELVNNDWHDTVLMSPGEKIKIALVADNPGKWLIHCHMLAHAKAGMLSWFEVNA